MIPQIKHWIAPPVFEQDETRTRRAGLLNAILITDVALVLLVMTGNLLGGRTPARTFIIDLVLLALFVGLWLWTRRGQVEIAGVVLLALGTIGLTAGVASLGTIRAPATATYFLVVMTGGLLFDRRGLVATTAASSLAVLGLIAAENAGLLPQADLSVTITQWITYTALFVLTGGLTLASLQSLRQALRRADDELARRERAEAALRQLNAELAQRVAEQTLEIRTVNETLEQRVAARTAEVRVANESLRASRLAALNLMEDALAAREQAEQASIEAENEKRRLEAMMEALPVGVALLDAQGGNVRSNSMYEQIWGGPRPVTREVGDYAAYKAWWADTGKPVQPDEWASSRAVQHGESVIGQMMEILRFDGARRFVINSGAPILDAYSRVVGSAVAIQDITDLRKAEQALRQAHDELEQRVQERTRELANANEELRMEIVERQMVEEHLRLQMTAVRAAANGIIITDRQGNVQWCNPAFTEMTGYTAAEVLGQNTRLFKSGQHTPEFYRRLWDTILSGEVWRSEMVNRRKDGSLYFEEQTIAPVFNERRELTHFVAVKQDITARKQAEAQLERNNQELRALSDAERHQRQLAETLSAANLALTQTLSLETVMETLLDYVGRLIPYDSANVMLLEAESHLSVRVMRGYERWTNADQIRMIVFDVQTNPVLNELFTTRKSILVADTRAHPGWEPRPGTGHVLSWLGVPLIAGGNVIGVYSLDKTEPGFFTQEHAHLAEMLVGQAAVAIQNAWLFEQVRAGRERLQSLSRRLVEVQEAERHYVARELHDEVGQALTSLKFSLSQLEPQADPAQHTARVAELKRMTDDVLESLHRLAMNLRPASLDHLGLVPALNQYVRATGDRYSLIAQFKAVDMGERLSPALETALYRIVQEALTNVVRHAHATRVDVLLERRGDQVIVVVEDDGVGFDAQTAGLAQSGHLGLVGMQERAEMLGGTLVVESTAGAGTTVVVEVPYVHSYPHR